MLGAEQKRMRELVKTAQKYLDDQVAPPKGKLSIQGVDFIDHPLAFIDSCEEILNWLEEDINSVFKAELILSQSENTPVNMVQICEKFVIFRHRLDLELLKGLRDISGIPESRLSDEQFKEKVVLEAALSGSIKSALEEASKRVAAKEFNTQPEVSACPVH